MFTKFDTLADKISQTSANFFKGNITIIIISFLAGFYVFGFDITNVTLAIDDEMFWASPYYGSMWAGLGRWGLVLLSSVIPMLSHPFTAHIVGLLALVLSAVVFVDKYNNISFSSKLVFCVLVATFPVFAFMSTFTTQIAYFEIGGLCSIIAYRFFDIAINQNKKLYYIPTILFLTLATGVYQCFLLLFIMPMAIDNIIRFINHNIKFKEIVKINIFSIAIMLAALLCSYIIMKLYNKPVGNYTDVFLQWFKADTFSILKTLIKLTRQMLFGNMFQFPPITLGATVALVLTALHVIYKKKNGAKQNLPLLFLLFALFIISAMSLNIALGGWVPTRILVSITFFFAGAIFIYHTVASKIEKLVIHLFVIFIVLFNGSYVTGLFVSNYFATEADKMVAQRVLDRIYDEAPEFYTGKTPVAFIGYHNFGKSPLTKKYIDIFGTSFWQWDRGNPDRMLKFMQMIGGVPMEARLANLTEQAMAREYAKNMPPFPVKESVQLHNGVVIVKFMIPN